MTKGLSIEECVEKAEQYISESGKCLLLFDVMESKKYDSAELHKMLDEMRDDLNSLFYEVLPANSLATGEREERGFQYGLGDGFWAGIESPCVIPEIVKYQEAKYPGIKLYWGVAKDGFDEEGMKIVR